MDNDLELYISATEKSLNNFAYFCKRCAKIRDKNGDVIPLIINDAQMVLVREIMKLERAKKPVRIVILKARQMGFSTIIELYILWRCLRGDGVYRSMEIADDKEASKDILEINRFAIKNLPDWFKRISRFETEYFSKYEIGFSNTGSLLSVTSSDSNQPGRSRTIHLLHLSEAAFYKGENAKALLKSVFGALSKSPKSVAFIESTANGPSGYFYNLYQRAKAGKNEYVALFFPWFAHTDYQMPVPTGVEVYCPPELADMGLTKEQLYWRQWVIDNDFQGDEDAFRVEYPATDEEAFLLQSATLFDKIALYNRIKELENQPFTVGFLVKKEHSVEFTPQPGERLHVFKPPVPGRTYAIGADVGSGVAVGDGDFSSADVVDVITGEQVAHLHEIAEPSDFGADLFTLGTWYNTALIAPEITGGHGLATVNYLRDAGYTYLYNRKVFDKIQQQFVDKVGWNTSISTRKMAVDNLRTDFRNGGIIINEIKSLEEMGSFVRNNSTGKYEAASGAKDDRVLSLAITNQVRKEAAALVPHNPQEPKEQDSERVSENRLLNRLRAGTKAKRGTDELGAYA